MPLIDRDKGAARLHLRFERRDLPDIDLAIDFFVDPPNMPERPSPFTLGFDYGIQSMRDRDQYLGQVEQNMQHLALALRDRLSDLAGWNGEERREKAEHATPGYGR